MTREFHSLTRLTPVAYLAAVNPEMGRWQEWPPLDCA